MGDICGKEKNPSLTEKLKKNAPLMDVKNAIKERNDKNAKNDSNLNNAFKNVILKPKISSLLFGLVGSGKSSFLYQLKLLTIRQEQNKNKYESIKSSQSIISNNLISSIDSSKDLPEVEKIQLKIISEIYDDSSKQIKNNLFNQIQEIISQVGPEQYNDKIDSNSTTKKLLNQKQIEYNNNIKFTFENRDVFSYPQILLHYDKLEQIENKKINNDKQVHSIEELEILKLKNLPLFEYNTLINQINLIRFEDLSLFNKLKQMFQINGKLTLAQSHLLQILKKRQLIDEDDDIGLNELQNDTVLMHKKQCNSIFSDTNLPTGNMFSQQSIQFPNVDLSIQDMAMGIVSKYESKQLQSFIKQDLVLQMIKFDMNDFHYSFDNYWIPIINDTDKLSSKQFSHCKFVQIINVPNLRLNAEKMYNTMIDNHQKMLEDDDELKGFKRNERYEFEDEQGNRRFDYSLETPLKQSKNQIRNQFLTWMHTEDVRAKNYLKIDEFRGGWVQVIDVMDLNNESDFIQKIGVSIMTKMLIQDKFNNLKGSDGVTQNVLDY